jgi:UDP-2,3-diacylglucosamine hydrolase
MAINCNPVVLFVADTHFHLQPDAQEQIRLRRFLEFLEMSCAADHLVLLGDIFDFWFDYPHFRLKGYEDLLYQLDNVAQSHTKIHFVGGNHDIWATAYLRERYGITGDGEAETVQFGDMRVRLQHGDGIFSHDWLYNSFRFIVRHPAGVLLGKSLHPEILYRLSCWLSGTSRNATRDEVQTMMARAERWLRRQRAASWDLMVIGHVHHPFIIEHQARRLAALGGWLDREGYGLLHDGNFELLDFSEDPRPDFSTTTQEHRNDNSDRYRSQDQ